MQQQTPAPDGHPYRLVVAQGSDLIDPIWTLAIRTGSGITAREWRFGCLNGDDPDFRSDLRCLGRTGSGGGDDRG